MSIVTLTLAGRNFKLSCLESSKPHIEKLAEYLNSDIGAVAKANPSASFEMLLVMVSLSLMDDKHSQIKESGGEALKNAEDNYQKQIASIFEELKNVANKF